MTTFYKMLATDPDAPSLTFRSWTVAGVPDLIGARYTGPKSGTTPFSNVTVVSTFNDGAGVGTLGRIVSPPPVSAWTWVNQGTSTAVDGIGSIYLEQNQGGAGDNFRILKRAAPTPPYTLTAAFIPLFDAVDSSLCAIVWRNASAGSLHMLESYWHSTNGMRLQIRRNTSPTVTSSNDADFTYASWMSGSMLWARLVDDNTNRTFHVSSDGQNFRQVASVTRTTFLTPDEIGFAVSPFSATRTGITLVSWDVTQP